MKYVLAIGTLLALSLVPVGARAANPVQKVLQLLSGLQSSIIKEGDRAQSVYNEFSQWCEDRSRGLGFDIKTGKGQAADCTAKVAKETASIALFNVKIEELTISLAKNEANLKAAMEIRAKEQARKQKVLQQSHVDAVTMLKHSLVDAVKTDLAEAKSAIAASDQAKAGAEGDLDLTSKSLAEAVETLGGLHHVCMTKAEEFEATTKSRGDELNALTKAKKVISESAGGAETIEYGLEQLSLLQMWRFSGVDLANFDVVRFIRDLARKQKDPALAQLASRLASAVRFVTADSEDPFAKVKGLISEMVERLQGQGQADAAQKAYCDKGMSEASMKRTARAAEIEKLATTADQISARDATLQKEVSTLKKELADLTASQAEMQKLRQEEHALFVTNQAELGDGVHAVKLGLKILREYYGQDGKSHEAAEGASSGIVGLLEVVESDFSKGLTEPLATEELSQVAYAQQMKDYKIAQATKAQDVKYKMQASVSARENDVHSQQREFVEYLEKLKEMCVAKGKAEFYEERQERRATAIAGLKEALQLIEGDTAALPQTTELHTASERGSSTLRGIRRH